ncbi:alpha/beta hydrolase [Geitlerinema sp. PCC 9228]|jgi:pimeloyl-ACP methyl ester carboxylesterase|uniref:alpha/beta fold hydrolase n=1 Tax=Geitlerinema sp. PCC 9228 TaxID=111611 RepID=UPI0008F9AE14|nr:alpha/beta hydrolase [Geitlerinema sp. PCC 9228]
MVDASHQDGTVITNGVRLHYVSQGEGPLILMLHGFPEFWYSWRYQMPEFAKDYRVVALDLRGYNESDKPQDIDAYHIDVLVQDIEGAIRGLGYDRCVLVGHDWGAAIAWHFAYAYPQMLAKLIIMNLPHPAKMAGFWQHPQQLLRSWYIFFFQLPLLPEWLLSANDCEAIGKAFRETAVDKNAFSDADLAAYRRAASQPGAIQAMLAYYRCAFDLAKGWLWQSQSWEKLDVPTLMVWGEEDTALGKELTYGTETYVRNFCLRYIPQCGHWVQQEKPETVNGYMREFLKKHGV